MSGDLNEGGLLDLLGVTPDTFRAATTKATNLDQDGYDASLWSSMVKASPELQRLAANVPVDGASPKYGEAAAGWRSMLQDTFGTFYKPFPDLLPVDQVEQTAQPNRPFIERLVDDPAIAQARSSTRLDELSAAVATLAAGETLLEEFRKRPDLRPAEPPKDAQGGGDGQGGTDGQADGEDGQQGGPGQQNEQSNAPSPTAIRRAIHKAAEAGRDKAAEAQEVLAGWGLETGDLTNVPMAQRLELVKKLLSGNLRSIADMIGRMKNLARARQRDRVDHARNEIHGIEMGNNLGRLLPSELAALSSPVRKLDFYRKFTAKSLLQYELRARETLGRGPLLSAIDISASMEGLPLTWAIGVNMGLVDTANRQRRQSGVAFFDTEVKKTIHWAPGEKNAEKLIDMATTGTAGGTKYQPALDWALTQIQTAGYQKADLVFTTDGQYQVDDEFLAKFLAEKARLQFRVNGVLIGGPKSGRRRDGNGQTNRLSEMDPKDVHFVFGDLARFCDEAWVTPALDPAVVGSMKDDIAGTIFSNIY